MLEEKFNDSELKEFEKNLGEVKGAFNSFAENLDNSFFEQHKIKKGTTRATNIYYAGGTLCLDLTTEDADGKVHTAVVMMNISDETINWIAEGKETKRLMDTQCLWFAFSIYGTVKGYHRKYYRECYQKSCIRHLYDFTMSRRKVDEKGSLPDDAIMGIYDMADKTNDLINDFLDKYGIKI